jgi:hypothetical protein
MSVSWGLAFSRLQTKASAALAVFIPGVGGYPPSSDAQWFKNLNLATGLSALERYGMIAPRGPAPGREIRSIPGIGADRV